MRTITNFEYLVLIVLIFCLAIERQSTAQTLNQFPTYNGNTQPADITKFIVNSPAIFKYNQTSPQVTRIGLGAFSLATSTIPTGIFHMKNTYSSIPLLKLESPADQFGYNGDSILFLGTKVVGGNNIVYGIIQAGHRTAKNYFQSRTGIGRDPDSQYMLDVNGGIHSTSFSNDALLTTNTFRLTNSAGVNKVLICSDIDGNSIWTDPTTILPNFWKLADDKTSIYLNKDNYTKVGIGTNKPLQMLHVVNGNILISRQDHQTKAFGSLNGSILFGEIANDTLPNGEWGIEYFNPDDSTGYYANGGLNFWKVGNPGHPGSNYNLFLRNNGNVGIGTCTPQSTLAVNGKVTAKEFEATLDGFPDYVFNSDYKLRSLKDLESYTQLHKHLPEIPSEKEVKEQGVKLAEMNALLVKKVEELTLYLYAMQKEIDALKAAQKSK